MLWLAGVDQSGCCLCGDVTAMGNIEGVTAHLSTPNYGGIQMSHTHTGEHMTPWLTLLRVMYTHVASLMGAGKPCVSGQLGCSSLSKACHESFNPHINLHTTI